MLRHWAPQRSVARFNIRCSRRFGPVVDLKESPGVDGFVEASVICQFDRFGLASVKMNCTLEDHCQGMGSRSGCCQPNVDDDDDEEDLGVAADCVSETHGTIICPNNTCGDCCGRQGRLCLPRAEERHLWERAARRHEGEAGR